LTSPQSTQSDAPPCSAQESRLSVLRAAITTTESTIEHALEGRPSNLKGQPLGLTKAGQDSAEEDEFVRFTWRFTELMFRESETYDTSLEQMNLIISYLLGTRFSPHPPSRVVVCLVAL